MFGIVGNDQLSRIQYRASILMLPSSQHGNQASIKLFAFTMAMLQRVFICGV